MHKWSLSAHLDAPLNARDGRAETFSAALVRPVFHLFPPFAQAPVSAQLRRPRPRLATSAMLKGSGRPRRRHALIVKMGTTHQRVVGARAPASSWIELFAFGSESTATASLLM